MKRRPAAAPAVVTRRIEAGAEQVWAVMARPGALVHYHPFCSENAVTAWPGTGAQDSIRYLSGVVMRRRFTAWHHGHGYELEIATAGSTPSHVRWTLVARGVGHSELTISIWPMAFSDYPAAVRWMLHRAFLLPLLRRYLDSVLRGLDYYLVTGRDVAPNQFGRLWYFSYGRRGHVPPGADRSL